MSRIWLFGEAEYETSESFEENYKRLFDVSECCGYMITSNRQKKTPQNQVILLEGTDLDVVKVLFSAGSKCNLLIISINQTTQDGSALAGKWKQVFAASTDKDGKVLEVLA